MMDTKLDGNYEFIGGQKSHSQQVSRQSIEVTNKSACEFPRVLNDDGAINESISMDIIFNSSASFLAMRDASGNNIVQKFRIIRQGFNDEDLTGIVTSFNETSGQDSVLSASVSINIGADSTLTPTTSGKTFPAKI